MPIDTLSQPSLGSNVIVVTANTGSIQNVNAVNFINTSTVTVTVAQGSTSNVANVSFTGSGRGIGIILALGG